VAELADAQGLGPCVQKDVEVRLLSLAMREKIWDYKDVILMLGNYFQVGQGQTSVRTEIVVGLTTFLTMAYIIFANPVILGDRTGMNRTAFIAVTCIVSAIGSTLILQKSG
jgi:hypothetical protein